MKKSAGYFRKNNSQLDPPWTQGCRIGNTNGLTLVVYMRNYNARSGFYNNNTLPLDTTTLIVKSSITGEVLTG